MLPGNRISNRKTGAAASFLLLALTLGFLFAEHFTVSAEVGEAKAAQVSSQVQTRKFEKLSADVAKASHADRAYADGTGPGGQQPWVRWSYIP